MSGKTCLFVAKANGSPCTLLCETAWGYCGKHTRSQQSRLARLKYEKESLKIVDKPNDDDLIKTVAQKITTIEPEPEPTGIDTGIGLGLDTPTVESTTTNGLDQDRLGQGPQVSVPDSSPLVQPVAVTTVDSPTVGVSKRAVPVDTSSPVEKESKSSIRGKKVKKPLALSKNKYGRYEDKETNIVFDPRSKQAYGVQVSGKDEAVPLTKKEIDVCVKNGWKYIIIEDDDEDDEDAEGGEDDEDDEDDDEDDEDDDEDDEDGEDAEGDEDDDADDEDESDSDVESDDVDEDDDDEVESDEDDDEDEDEDDDDDEDDDEDVEDEDEDEDE